ncbi:MAG: glycerophosphodiester phosphodiesterase [Alphaproteobacteria bacterium]
MISEYLIKSLSSAKVVAHRGFSGQFPENTLTSFREAALNGAKWVELDVMLSKDGVPLVFHDETLDRMSGFSGRLDDFTFSELSQLKIKNIEKIAKLEEVLALIFEKKMKVNIEVKPSRSELAEKTAIKAFEAAKFFNAEKDGRVLFSSFNTESLKTIRTLSGDAAIGVLTNGEKEKALATARDLKAFSIHCSVNDASEDFLMSVYDNGMNSLVYTVNDRQQAYEILRLGALAVFSDYPNILEN